LIFKDKTLENDQTVGDYEIGKGAQIDLSCPKLPIYIKMPSGRCIPMEVTGLDGVRVLKEKIEEKEG
jgi:hypothetical protein